MTLNKALAGALVIQVIILGSLVANAEPSKQPVSSTAPFSHANCQYPHRWTNPPNGCDNSDPAVPECIKEFSTEAGEKACIDEFVKQNTQPVQSEPTTVMEGK